MVTMTPLGDQARQGQCNHTINPPGKQNNRLCHMRLHENVHNADKWQNAINSAHKSVCNHSIPRRSKPCKLNQDIKSIINPCEYCFGSEATVIETHPNE